MNSFEKLGLGSGIVSVLEKLKFEEPSEIQAATIPQILEGKDLIGNAATGSGKTLAFASGIIEKVEAGKGVQALVLTPTRELAEQITKVTRVFAKNSKLKILDVYGGVSIGRQVEDIKNSEVIVGTPGRILDHLQRETLDLFELKVLVLDEADRMVDMGFLPDVEKIISQCPMKRQTLLFSATSSPDVDYIAKKYMKNPENVVVEQYVDASKLKQVYYDVPSHLKFSLLVHLLKAEKSGIVMVFCNTRKNVDFIAANLRRYKIHSQAIHGGLDQGKRNRIMESFHKNEADILICTDVAARGLDIKGVTHVYNYDAPKTSDEYIHRIGRTARAGKEGMAISIVSNRDYDNFRRVMEDDSLHIEMKEMPEVEKVHVRFDDKGYGRGYGKVGGDKRRFRNAKSFRSGSKSRGYGNRDDRRDKPHSRRGSRPPARRGRNDSRGGRGYSRDNSRGRNNSRPGGRSHSGGRR